MSTTGPTIHLIVEEQRIGELTDYATARAFDVLNDAKSSVGRYIAAASEKAYREGVRDGFAQGCIAESKSSAERPTPAFVSPEDATAWPTFQCEGCGYTQGPFPDDEKATAILPIIAAHAAWCPAKDREAAPDAG